MRRDAPFRSLIRLLSPIRIIIILPVVVTLIAMTVAIMIFTQKEVDQAMLNAGDEEARNILKVVKLNIENQQQDLVFFQRYAEQKYEQQLKNMVSVVFSQIDYFHSLAAQGLITEDQAQKAALAAVEKIRYGNNDYFFIYDSHGVAVSHPDPRVRGRDMSGFKDDKGRPVLKTMREMSAEKKEGVCTMWWTKLAGAESIPKLLYFSRYSPWNWMVGTGVYIDDIDRDIARKRGEIMAVLKKTFAEVKVFETGYFTVFDGGKKILIHPFLAGRDGAGLKDPVTGRKLMDDLMVAARNPETPLPYLWDKPSAPGDYSYVKYSHVDYFPPFDWYIASSVYEDEMERPAQRIIRRQLLFVSAVVLLCMIAIFLLVKLVTEPLARLTRHAERLGETDFSLSAAGMGELSTITFPAEISLLSRTMLNMEQKLGGYLKTLAETTAARERMASELRIAREIQMSMLPREDISLASGKRVDLAAVLEPAREVGGDLYDYFFIDPEHLCIVVGDVSDKGVPAALFMARSKALFRNAALREQARPAAILQAVNQELCAGNEMRMFITTFIGILDLRSGDLTFSNAGHIPPLLFGEQEGAKYVVLPRGKPVGIHSSSSYTDDILRMRSGDALLVFTDGVPEALNSRGQFFDDERLRDLLQAHPPPTATAALAIVLREVKVFSEGTPQADDIAILCIRYVG
jgi:phosphoserine phosphatase RsbU/P